MEGAHDLRMGSVKVDGLSYGWIIFRLSGGPMSFFLSICVIEWLSCSWHDVHYV